MAVIPPDPKYLLRSDMGCIHSLLFWINSDVEHLYAGCALGKVYIWDLKVKCYVKNYITFIKYIRDIVIYFL